VTPTAIPTTEPDPDQGVAKNCSATSYGPRGLKLLTRVEYQNSIEDLVGIDFNVSETIPSDSLVEGYFNNAFTPVTESHADAYLSAAEKVAQWSAQRNFQGVVDCGFDDSGNASVSAQECQSRFLDDFGTRAFRRPLTEAEKTTYQALFADSLTGGDIKAGIELGITALLSSPRFLYRSEVGTAVQDLKAGGNSASYAGKLAMVNGVDFQGARSMGGTASAIDLSTLDSDAYVLTDYEMAGFLSYTITGSTPDDALLTAAKSGELSTQAQLEAQIERLLATDKAKRHMGVFAAQWLGSDEVINAQRDSSLFPDFTAEVREAMAAEAKALFTHAFYDDTQGFSGLFNADYVFVNDALANYYGLQAVGTTSTDPLEMVKADAAGANRGGVLTLGAIMANLADLTESSPIKRAASVRARMLCQDIPKPDDTIASFRAEKSDELIKELKGQVISNRDFVAGITKESPCDTCHDEIINPLGFGFEDYDAAGRYRMTDANGLSIDSSGTLYGVHSLYDGEALPFSGGKDLSNKFAELASVQSCFSANVFRYAMDVGHTRINGDSEQAGELTAEEKVDYSCSVDTLTSTLATSNSMRELFTRLATLDLIRFRKQRDR
jgi:hypothetical protein